MEYYDSGEWRGTKALDGGGSFINQAIHFIDLLLSVMGPVKNVTAKTRTVSHNIEVEDIHGKITPYSYTLLVDKTDPAAVITTGAVNPSTVSGAYNG